MEMDLEDEIKKIQENLKNRVSTQMISEFRKDLETKIGEIEESIEKKYESKIKEIDGLKTEIDGMKKEVNKIYEMHQVLKEDIDALREYTLKYEKFMKKLRYIEEVIGTEEEIDVNKVPPNILQLVYQYTLNDIIYNLRKFVGIDESERIVNEVMQDVRTRTSGTELFKFREGKIITKDIEKAIEKKLISPKQVHSTYVEIVSRLREYIPHYIPKNFASLMRTKGQEYAIETTTENRLRIEMMERNLEKLRNELSYQENMWREELLNQKMSIEMKINEAEEKTNGKLEELNKTMNIIKEDINKIYEIMGKIIPYLEIYRVALFKDVLSKIPNEGITLDDLNLPKEVADDFVEYARNSGLVIEKDGFLYSDEKLRDSILETVPSNEFLSFSEIKKRTKYDKEILLSILNKLVEEKLLEEKKYGKGKKYKRR